MTTTSLEALSRRLAELEASVALLTGERDGYKRAFLELVERYRLLELGILQKRERVVEVPGQLALDLIGMSLAASHAPTPEDAAVARVREHVRNVVPRGKREALPDHLPRILHEIVPEEVQQAGLASFDELDPEVSETLERRRSSLVVLRISRRKFALKGKVIGPELATEKETDLLLQRADEVGAHAHVDPSVAATESTGDAIDGTTSASNIGAVEVVSAAQQALEDDDDDAKEEATRGSDAKCIYIAPAPVRLLAKSILGPGFIADSIVRRFKDCLPANRLEKIYAREGFEVPRSTLCALHLRFAESVRRLYEVMWGDARLEEVLCTDATTVKVQAKDKCRQGYIWIVIAPGRHILFRYSAKHNRNTISAMLGDFRGLLVADAHAVYDHLFADDKVVECACWSHARRYFFKALATDRELAIEAISMIRQLFKIEADVRDASRREREEARQKMSRPLVEAFEAWCHKTRDSGVVLSDGPLDAALRYVGNQREALRTFLSDGRVPMHNNASERGLRNHAVGRKNWLFFGSDDGGEANAIFSTFIASCELHGVDPVGYLIDLQTLLPRWPEDRLLELAPVNYAATVSRREVQRTLAADIHRTIALDPGPPMPATPGRPHPPPHSG